jgi:hypothetical protein
MREALTVQPYQKLEEDGLSFSSGEDKNKEVFVAANKSIDKVASKEPAQLPWMLMLQLATS